MASMRHVTILSVAALLVSCGAPTPGPLRLASGSSARPASALLLVATDLPAERREVVVDARRRRTSLGHFRQGDRVEIQAIAGTWAFTRGAEPVGANGLPTMCVAPAGPLYGAPSGAAPGMGLMLYERPEPEPARCAATQRLFIPNGVEMHVPETAHLFLAPNDLDDEMGDNTGSVRVQVDISPSKTAPILHTQQLEVRANVPRTPLGVLLAGSYLRVSVSGGRWSHDPEAGDVGPGGDPVVACAGDGAHSCAAGEGAPRMGLVLLLASCFDGGVPTPTGEERTTYLGAGKLVTVLGADAELAAGPNDWAAGYEDNEGALTLEVLTQRASPRGDPRRRDTEAR